MPMPPVLPTLDWKAVFDSGTTYDDWIKGGTSPENRDKMETLRRAQVLDPQLAGFLAALPRPVRVVAIAEDWCGDVVKHVPVLARMAEAAPNLQVRFVSRVQHPDVFVRYLTNGGEAIPKFIFLSEKWVECGNWGPMPEALKELIARGKACGDVAAARRKVSALYEADPARHHTQRELMALLDIAACAEP
jgi:thiol-disulfide isomerase/thioredoxin